MALSHIRLQHFRSYADRSFELSPAVNIIAGPNASGKTNLLEAVLVVARGGSYRVKDAELVAYGQPWARLDALTDAGTPRSVKLECPVEAPRCKKSFVIDGKPFLRLSPQKALPVVLFEPDHLQMLSGSPELRRSYADDLLEQTVPGFGTARRQYRRVLAQRNALLKQGLPAAGRQLFVWNVRLGELAGRLVRERLRLLETLNAMADEVYNGISAEPGGLGRSASLRLEYVSSVGLAQYESALLHAFEKNLERDVLLGFTTTGPHRDDIRVRLNGHAAQESASRGETRTIVLTLKIIELQLVAAANAQLPMLLLDDVFSELDGRRRRALTRYLQAYQTFITTTDADVFAKQLRSGSNLIETSLGDG